MTLTVNLLTQNSIEVLLGSLPIHVWSIMILCQRKWRWLCRNCKKFKVQIWPWPLDPKINRGLPMVNTCVKYHHFMSKGKGVIVQKPLFHRQADKRTNGQTDWHASGETSIPPTTSLAGDISILPPPQQLMTGGIIKHLPWRNSMKCFTVALV